MVDTPHDRLFRHTFSQPEHAASLIKSNLPDVVARRIDWSSLSLQPGSFVDEKLKWRHTDLLFSARLSNRQALLYVLVEHQSSVDHLMPFRVLRYLVRVWEAVLAKEPERKNLPPVIPVVVHHGDKRWDGPTTLGAILDLDGELRHSLAPHFPELAFILDDLSGQSDADLRSRALTQLAVLTAWSLQNLPHSDNPLGDFARVLDLVASVAHAPRGLDALTRVLRYFMEVSEPDPGDLRQLLEQRVDKPVSETLMSTAEKLRAEGRAEGEAKGRAEGEAKGRAEGRAETLLKLLALKFGKAGKLPAAIEKRVRSASIEDLGLWTERVLTAKTLAAVWSAPAPAKKRR